jgi:hypothetical protein
LGLLCGNIESLTHKGEQIRGNRAHTLDFPKNWECI